MATIKAQRIPKPKGSPDDLLALFIFYFPQYTLKQAKKMPNVRLRKMLKVVKKEEARKNITLLEIITAPHAKKATVKSLFEKFNAIINE